MKLDKFIIPVIILLVSIASGCKQDTQSTQDWPQFLGPNRNSTSDQTGLLTTWPETGPEVLWTVNVGIGFGGPAIKDGKVYLLDRNDQVGDIMRCFDFNNGEELWKYAYDAPGSVMFPGSRSVPTVNGNNVYSCGPYGDLYCIDINTHEPVWKKNIWTDYGGDQIPTWAITQCPLVYGDLLIVASQAPEAGVVAYDNLTGDIKWETQALGPAGYVSPAIVKIGGEDHVVMITASERSFPGRPQGGQEGPPQGKPPQSGPPQGGPPQGAQRQEMPQEMAVTMGKVVGIKPLTGEILWEYANWECHIPVASAVDAGEGRLLVAGGYELGVVMIKVEKQADGSYSVSELFRHEDFGEHTKPPLLYNNYFYGQYTTNSRRDGLVCMNMDGEIMWKTGRSPLFDKGSMILVDGLILATDGRKTLYLIEPDTTGFKPLASADMLAEGGTGSENDPMASRVGGATQNWAPLAIANGKLLIRDQNRMMCVVVAK
jgi:outer membrane protein assembly factor BamB